MKEKIIAIMAEVFEIPISDFPTEITQETIENWDSLTHLNLIVELEEAFNKSFEPEEISKMTSIEKIMSCIIGTSISEALSQEEDSSHEVRYATKEDFPLIVEFIDNHWKKNHAVVKSKTLMDFCYLNPITGDYNFIIAQNKQTKKLDAIKGFIPTYKYDVNLAKEVDLWAAIWKTRKDLENFSNLSIQKSISFTVSPVVIPTYATIPF